MPSRRCWANRRAAALSLLVLLALLTGCAGRGGSVTDLGEGETYHAFAKMASVEWNTAPAAEPVTDAGADAAPAVGPAGTKIVGDRFYLYPDLSSLAAVRDTFLVLTFGWGHGVGMSQYGAVGYARQGYDYIQILQHYYTGVAVFAEQPPAAVRCEGQSVPTEEMVARVVEMEIAGITKENDPAQAHALRAQAVAAYTNMKHDGYTVQGCAWADSYAQCRPDVKAAAHEVAGQYLAYDGQPIAAFYSACMAGMTAAYIETWGEGERDLPYLRQVISAPDLEYEEFITVTAFTPEQMRNYIRAYDSGIRLGDDPSQWLRILQHDDAVNESIGYVLSMQIGDKVIGANAGLTFRDEVMQYDLKSPCFAILYNGNYL